MNSPARSSFLDRLMDRPSALILYLGFHAVLAVTMRTVPGFSKVHGLIVLGAGLVFCLRRSDPKNWIYLAGYLTAGEVLWKMTRGAIFWEQGKYSLILAMLLALWQTRRFGNPLPVAQFALLIPSSLITIALLPISLARDALSFNLSGPLCLCVTAFFLSTVVLRERDLCKLLVVMLGPIAGIAFLTAYNLATVPVEVEFTNRANYFVTGGFGPNQVSAALGLGIVAGALLLLGGKLPSWSRLVVGGCVLLFVSQSALTLSRNGLYCGIGASLAAAPFLLTDPKVRRRFVLAVPVLAGLFVFAVLPTLDSITDGGVSRRLEETSSTGRSEIIEGELELWKQNPIFGVGPGVARYVRGDVWEAAAHTEYSRLLAEHGLFGVAALVLYPVMALMAFLSAATRLARATIVAGVSWSMSFMLVNAMRMAAPSLLFGMAFLRIEPDARPRPRRKPLRSPQRVGAAISRPSFSGAGIS